MVVAGDPPYPFQWEATMNDGTVAFIPNGVQSDARKIPRPIREIRVQGPNLPFPFSIPFPPNAKPVIFQRGLMTATGGGVGDELAVKHHGYRYFFGWEKDDKVSLWEFGNGPPTHHDSV